MKLLRNRSKIQAYFFTSDVKSGFPGGTFNAIKNGVLVRLTISLNSNDKPIGRLNRKYVVAKRPFAGKLLLYSLLNPLPKKKSYKFQLK